MRICVTGHLGFIGSHVLRVLGKHEVAGVDKKTGMNIAFGKFLWSACKFKPDLIVHLAATCSTSHSLLDPAGDFRDNTIGTFNVCEVARITGAKVLYTSTCKVVPGEDGARTPYGLTKYMGELILEEYNKVYGVEYIINRPGTIYGQGQEGSPESGWLAWFIKAKRENLPIIIYGDGKQSRDVLWVEDYTKLIKDQIENWDKYKGQVYNIGGGEWNELTLLEALELLEYKNYTFAEERKDIKRFMSDNKLVSSINGWEPQMGYQEGIKKLL